METIIINIMRTDMPEYEYICDACKAELLIEQKISDDPLKTCPQCNKDKLKRLISSGTNFTLKGSGWAKDNYSK